MLVTSFAVIGEVEADSLIFWRWTKTDEDFNHEGDEDRSDNRDNDGDRASLELGTEDAALATGVSDELGEAVGFRESVHFGQVAVHSAVAEEAGHDGTEGAA